MLRQCKIQYEENWTDVLFHRWDRANEYCLNAIVELPSGKILLVNYSSLYFTDTPHIKNYVPKREGDKTWFEVSCD